jgi:hypothetical protein
LKKVPKDNFLVKKVSTKNLLEKHYPDEEFSGEEFSRKE